MEIMGGTQAGLSNLLMISLGLSYNLSHVRRCIHIALLCLQQLDENRSTIFHIFVVQTGIAMIPSFHFLKDSSLLIKLVSRVETESNKENDSENQGQDDDVELPIFGLPTIALATDSFSMDSKLVEGGFGTVHKGTLPNGQEIAVKRLSKSSGKGLNEFKSEVKLIAKLQH
ncbi:Uncharacterized protein TCM_031157 [Theobroma cacao]|uniref:Protein kinase domain-containing protein n=1 Tax=Theobroma cacao TaxID=3641 RepID=A0A061F5Q9_THECC|nr:Uncharacterized protein TCM_031157 [Theobroma cacao]